MTNHYRNSFWLHVSLLLIPFPAEGGESNG